MVDEEYEDSGLVHCWLEQWLINCFFSFSAVILLLERLARRKSATYGQRFSCGQAEKRDQENS